MVVAVDAYGFGSRERPDNRGRLTPTRPDLMFRTRDQRMQAIQSRINSMLIADFNAYRTASGGANAASGAASGGTNAASGGTDGASGGTNGTASGGAHVSAGTQPTMQGAYPTHEYLQRIAARIVPTPRSPSSAGRRTPACAAS